MTAEEIKQVHDSPAFRVKDDLIPSILTQAKMAGWKAGIFSFGKAEDAQLDYFNPGIVERPDGRWLVVRRSRFVERFRFGQNDVVAFKLDDNNVPMFGNKIRISTSHEKEQFEDPRVIYYGGKTWLSCCNFVWYGGGRVPAWSGAHQVLAECDNAWGSLRYDPNYGNNGGGLAQNRGHEKNWLFFWHKDELYMLYQGPPNQVIVRFGKNKYGGPVDEVFSTSNPKVEWPHGIIRGGTPPVLHNGEYWTFFHSSMDWKPPYRRYYMGAYSFESKAPFRPLKMTMQAILIGSQNDFWQPMKPLVVFPCGAIMKNDTWFVTLGVNDLKCGHISIPHDDIEILSEGI